MKGRSFRLMIKVRCLRLEQRRRRCVALGVKGPRENREREVNSREVMFMEPSLSGNSNRKTRRL